MSLKKILALSVSGILVYSCSQNTNNEQLLNNAPQSISIYSDSVKLDKPSMTEVPSPNKNPRPSGAQINTIVLHHTASKSSANATANFFTDPAAKVSAHYTVDRTGYIVQSVKDAEASWHAGKSEFNGVQNVNDFSIGIEISNVGDNVEAYPDVQYDSIIKLVSYLVKTYNIPLANITRHRDVCTPPGRKTDTSNNFSTSKVIDGVKSVLRGEYNPELKPSKPVTLPNSIPVTTTKNMTLEDLADVYLDNEVRANEIAYLNPKLEGSEIVKEGTVVKIPTDYNIFYQLRKKQ